MLAVSQKPEYLTWPVEPDWCQRVREALDAMPRGARSRLAEFLTRKTKRNISTGHLTDVLKGKYDTTDLMEPIHEFLEWSPPMPPTASLDAGELVHIRQRLTGAQAKFLERAAETLDGQYGEQARRSLMEMLKLFERDHSNDN